MQPREARVHLSRCVVTCSRTALQVFVDSLYQSGIEYDYAKRRIFPLLQDAGLDLTDPATFPDVVRRLLRANVSYCLHGDDSVCVHRHVAVAAAVVRDLYSCCGSCGGVPRSYRELVAANGVDSMASLESFQEKYAPFFVEDYRYVHTTRRLAAVQWTWHLDEGPTHARVSFPTAIAKRYAGGPRATTRTSRRERQSSPGGGTLSVPSVMRLACTCTLSKRRWRWLVCRTTTRR